MEILGHNKVIKTIALKAFKPYGIRRKGQSRFFIDDHGWFTIGIEFQPSKSGNGTYLNVGVNFNWNIQEYFSFDIGDREFVNIGNEKRQFFEYIDDKQFTETINKLCEFSIKKVNGYRNSLENINVAEKMIIRHKYHSDSLWGNYHRGIISGLIGNTSNLNKYFDKLLKEPENNIEWIIKLKKEVEELKNVGNNNVAEFIVKIKAIITETRKLKKLEELEIII